MLLISHWIRILTTCLVLTGAIALTGCAATPDDLGGSGLPQGFSLDLTILNGDQQSLTRDGDPPPHVLRHSRYVLFADGSLHYGADAQRDAAWLPPRVRVLNQTQMQRTWSVLQALSFADSDRGKPPVNFKLLQAQLGEVRYLADLMTRDQRWTFDRTSDAGTPDHDMGLLIAHLATLAFADDIDAARRPVPQRYDFGPDPYEQYR